MKEIASILMPRDDSVALDTASNSESVVNTSSRCFHPHHGRSRSATTRVPAVAIAPPGHARPMLVYV
jgi:hypothetical protein